MRREAVYLLALGAATLAPTTLTVAYFGVELLFTSPYPNNGVLILIAIFAFVVSLGHIVVMGIPGLMVLSKMGQLRAWTVCALGFVCGCLPMSFFSWPIGDSTYRATNSHWDGEKMVQTLVDGVPTLLGWIDYGKGVLSMGMLGAVAALVFWQVWKRSLDRHPPL